MDCELHLILAASRKYNDPTALTSNLDKKRLGNGIKIQQNFSTA